MLIRILTCATTKEIKSEMRDIDVDEYGIDIMLPKAQYYLIKIDKIKNISANIIKQQMLSLGGDAAISRKSLVNPEGETGAILMGTRAIFISLAEKLKKQPFGLKDLAKEITALIKIRTSELQNSRTLIMGILNLTPDSFYDGGKYNSIEKAIDYAKNMIDNGADIIDIGGESTRPGFKSISLEEEKARVLPVVEALLKKYGKHIKISIDTTKADIADKCLNMGASIINDVSGLSNDPQMIKIAVKYNVPIVIMHCNGPLENIFNFFQEKIEWAITNKISYDNIILDPGIGFGKKGQDNLLILRKIKEFKSFGLPILVGASRKSFIGEILSNKAEERLAGSLAVAVYCALNDVDILRVHDVKETAEAVKIANSL